MHFMHIAENLTELRTSLPLVLLLFYFFSCLCMLTGYCSWKRCTPGAWVKFLNAEGIEFFFDFIRALQNSTFLDEWS
ncbi:hypothetical protein BDC45DRAFT_513000 [Circinella umbellata]|nr:hypothetical protein BDC45DRAFT_513000 [Circinella umbellata]